MASSAVAFRGVLGRLQYCGFAALDAQQVQEEELVRTAPDWLCRVGQEDGIAAPPVEASLIVVTFVNGNTLCRLVSETCDPHQLATFRDVVLGGDGLVPESMRQ